MTAWPKVLRSAKTAYQRVSRRYAERWHSILQYAEARTGIGGWLSFYNDERQHQSLGYRTPRQIYQEGLWICGRSALPRGCACPASRAGSESKEMLAFAHIPTGTTTNNEFANDEVNGKLVEPAVASTAIGADIKTGRATP
jgi:hypothetical protein